MSTQPNIVDQDAITEAVEELYTELARSPSDEYHFPTGRKACLFVGYPEEEIDDLPTSAVESFAGVGYPFRGGSIREGDTVVDVGAGSGTDLLLAARAVTPKGRAIGIDFNETMIRKAEDNVRQAGVEHAELLTGDVRELPLEDEAVDVVTSNGVINLVPDKRGAFREILRVLRPGGRLQIADIVLSTPVGESSKANPQLWAECIVGAETEKQYLTTIREAGFNEIQVVDRLDYFSVSPNPDTRNVADELGAHSIVLTAKK